MLCVDAELDVDPKIYESMKIALQKYHPEKSEEMLDCIIDEFRSQETVNKFYAEELLIEDEKLAEEIEPYLLPFEEICSSSARHKHVRSVAIIFGGLMFIVIAISIAYCRSNREQLPTVEVTETVV